MANFPFSIREWTVSAEIGRGGMGVVYKATHEFIKGDYAIKMIKPQLVNDKESRERFLQEASVLAGLNHPGIIDTDKILQEGETLYLPMEFLTGEGFDVIAQMHPEGIDPEWVTHLILQCAEALGYAHEKGVLHRDLKLSNIFLQKNGEIKVLDFGLAKGLGDKSMTATGMIVGTPAYVPPEVMKGEKTRPCSDIYSLGIIAFRLVTGQMPIDVPDQDSSLWSLIGSVIQAHEKGLPKVKDIKPDTPDEIAKIIDSMLSTNPDFRPADGKALALLLKNYEDKGSSYDVDKALDRTRMAMPTFKDFQSSGSGNQIEIDPDSEVTNVKKKSSGKLWLIAATLIFLILAGIFISKILTGDNAGQEKDSSITAETGNKKPVKKEKKEHVPKNKEVLITADVENMIIVPAGSYFIGCGKNNSNCYEDEKPGYVADLKEFKLMKYEVTVEQYKECVDKSICPIPEKKEGCNWDVEGRENHPINCIDWNTAEIYCRVAGLRLPTEEEWEAAAGGKEHADYVWGFADAFCRLAVMADEKGPGCGKESTWEVGSRIMDKSWVGVFDMQGNVREWSSSFYKAYEGGNISEEMRGKKANRGGSWIVPKKYMNTVHTRGADLKGEKQPDLGFRCAK